MCGLIAALGGYYSPASEVLTLYGAAVDGSSVDGNLTERERDVLQLIASGKSSKEIARHLGIAVGGVNIHFLNAMKKLGAATRAHAVARSIFLGLLLPEVGRS
ncbi:MAG: helix-turn-helix transcriptional regulator [Magnetospirillum sp.]|nr:helix-turn-helix transcriptional regulator [Magnetospirillum sp.]